VVPLIRSVPCSWNPFFLLLQTPAAPSSVSVAVQYKFFKSKGPEKKKEVEVKEKDRDREVLREETVFVDDLQISFTPEDAFEVAKKVKSKGQELEQGQGKG
jgi:hypothetical protein